MVNPNLTRLHSTSITRTLPDSKIKNDKLRREDYYKLMCPRCRHQVVVEDAF